MPDQENLISLNRKLDVIIQLLAYQTVSGMTITQGVPILRRLGLNSAEIASIFATTKKTVQVRMAEARKSKKQ